MLEISKNELINFMYKAKRSTFASTEIKMSMMDNSSFYSYRELPWNYVDHYIGNNMEAGREVISYNTRPVWALVYRGGYLEPFWDKSSDIVTFLRHALMNLPADNPIRGPQNHKEGDFEYANKIKGDFLDFTGREEIFINKNLVYFHDYAGGLIVDKYFPYELID